MIALTGRSKTVRLRENLTRRVWALAESNEMRNTPLRKTALILDEGTEPTDDFDLYLVRGDAGGYDHLENVIVLPEELGYLKAGDCVSISSDGLRLRVLWRLSSTQNFLFLTERCNHFCIMCSQPPRDIDDSQHLRDARELLELLPATTSQLGITGGEPTLYGLELIDLLARAKDLLPSAGVHLLTNGRAFAALDYAKAWASILHPDLMAAIPSIVLGLWGAFVFTDVAAGWSKQLNSLFGWIPIFENNSDNFLRSPFIAGLVVTVMIVPIIASITREIFSQMDRDIINASLALGGNRESTLRKVILPTASGGIIGGVLLGLGRALGETVAVLYVLNISFDINWGQVLEARGGSVASMIISKFGEANPSEISALMAAGLVLFIFTLIINSIASYIVAKAQPWRK